MVEKLNSSKIIKSLSIDWDTYILDNQVQFTVVNTEFGYIMSLIFIAFLAYGVVF